MKNFGGRLGVCTVEQDKRVSYHFTYSGETIYSEMYHFACYLANWYENHINCTFTHGYGIFSEEELRTLLKENSKVFSNYTVNRRLHVFKEKGWWG